MMNVGTKATFILPSGMAYGERGAGRDIPPFSPLLFEVELLEVEISQANRIPTKEIKDKEKSRTTAKAPTYSIISKDEIRYEKISLNIRLSRKCSESQLSTIAREIKDRHVSGPYKRVFMLYYLPGMPVGDGAWATSHYTPSSGFKIDIIDYDNPF
jgi:hypothetical protein